MVLQNNVIIKLYASVMEEGALPPADITGKSDPYCMVGVAISIKTSKLTNYLPTYLTTGLLNGLLAE